MCAYFALSHTQAHTHMRTPESTLKCQTHSGQRDSSRLINHQQLCLCKLGVFVRQDILDGLRMGKVERHIHSMVNSRKKLNCMRQGGNNSIWCV